MLGINLTTYDTSLMFLVAFKDQVAIILLLLQLHHKHL